MNRRRLLIPALISMLVLASVIAAYAVRHQQESSARSNAAEDAGRRAEELRSHLQSSIGGLNGVVGFVRSEHATQRRFERFSAPLLTGEPTLRSVSLQLGVSHGDRAAFERHYGEIVEPSGARLIPAPERQHYTVVAYSAQRQQGPVTHLNVEAEPTRAAALTRASIHAEPTATSPVRLFEDGSEGFLVFIPIYKGGIVPAEVSDRRNRAIGYAVGTFRSAPFARRALADVANTSTGFVVTEGERQVLSRGEVGEDADDIVSRRVTVANQTWTVSTTIANPSLFAPFAIVGAGLLLALLTGLVLAALLSSEQVAQRLADRRVAELDLAQRALEESERHYRLLAENSSDFVARHTADGRFIYVSPASQSMVGYAPEELIGKLNWEYIHPDDVPRMREVYGGFLGGANIGRVETRFKRKDGKYIWLESSVRTVRDPNSGAIVETHVSHRDVSERKRLEKELRQLADQDPLTGLRNRRSFTQELERELASIERYGGEATLMLIDVDDLKGTNDTYGHAAGDSLLIGLSETLQARLRESDLVGRLGGDEFSAVLRTAGPGTALEVAESVLLALQTQAIEVEGATLAGIRVSMGLATFGRWSATTAEGLISRADKALYQAKTSEYERVVSISIGLDEADGR